MPASSFNVFYQPHSRMPNRKSTLASRSIINSPTNNIYESNTRAAMTSRLGILRYTRNFLSYSGDVLVLGKFGHTKNGRPPCLGSSYKRKTEAPGIRTKIIGVKKANDPDNVEGLSQGYAKECGAEQVPSVMDRYSNAARLTALVRQLRHLLIHCHSTLRILCTNFTFSLRPTRAKRGPVDD